MAKKNPNLPIKITENVHLTYKHCKRLIITSTDVVLYLYSPLYELALLLMSTKMPVKILRLIIDSYVRQSTRISWDNVYTNYFQLLNRVKQGGGCLRSCLLYTLMVFLLN